MRSHRARRRALLVRTVSGVLATVLVACSDQGPPPRVESVDVTAPTNTLLHGPGGGQSLQITAVARAANGNAIDRQDVTWSAQPAGVVTVSPAGLVTAVAVGTVSVRATIAEKTGQLILSVQPVPVARVDITTPALNLSRTPLTVGTAQVAAVAYDSTNTVLPDRPFAWQSSNSSVASVNSTGLVSAVSAGSAFIIAFDGARRDSVSVTVTVNNTLPPGFDVAITNAQWTQATQFPDGRIPMLTGGRAAVVNVVTSATSAVSIPSEFELRLLNGDGSTAWSARRSAVIPAGPTSLESPTLQFLVPASALRLNLRWEVRWNPDGSFVDASPSSDRWPRAAATNLAVVEPPQLKLRFVPVSLSSHGGATGNVNIGNVEEYLRVVRQFAPVGGIEYSIAPPFPTDASFGMAPTGGGSTFWIALLQQLDAARVASPEHADAHWVGIVLPPSGFNFATFGGFGYIPSSGTSFGPGTRTFALVNINWFFRESQSRELVMHELGHNLGRLHSPCGGAGGPDPSFPIIGGRTGPGGHDTYSFERGFASAALGIPSDHGDIMGYCSPVWISSYSYDAMLRFRGSATLALRQPEPAQQALVVYGLAHDDGRVVLDRSVRVDALRAIAPDAGDWEATVSDRQGSVLARRRFSLTRMDHLSDAQSIVVAVPLSDADHDRAERIEVRSPSGRTSRIPYRVTTPSP